jgi:hypothetical protein
MLRSEKLIQGKKKVRASRTFSQGKTRQRLNP